MIIYLGLSLAGERRLLADLVALEVPEDMGTDVLSGLARSDAFAATGRSGNLQSASKGELYPG
jgi:hypothetical protein